jgi:hypothetical protein
VLGMAPRSSVHSVNGGDNPIGAIDPRFATSCRRIAHQIAVFEQAEGVSEWGGCGPTSVGGGQEPLLRSGVDRRGFGSERSEPGNASGRQRANALGDVISRIDNSSLVNKRASFSAPSLTSFERLRG